LKRSFLSALNRLGKLNIPYPLLLLGGAAVSFGALAPFLGFYWDDWQFIYLQDLVGPLGFWPYFAYDRPFSPWTHLVVYNLLGDSPFAWQVYALVLRYLTALGFWIAFRGLWPTQKALAGWGGLIFLLYPLFSQQPISVAYSQHWTCYLLAAFSMAAMIWAFRRHAETHWLHPLARALAALSLFTMEYFAGIEIFRAAVLLVLAPRELNPRGRILWALRRWLPYLGIFVVYLVWRLALAEYPAGVGPNQPLLLYKLAQTPFQSAARLVTMALQDLTHVFVTGWARWLPAETLNLADRFNLLALAAALGAGLVCAWQMLRADEPAGAAREAIFLGLCAVLIGLLPTWLTDRQIIVGLYSDRFGLTILPGIALALSGWILWLTPRRLARTALLGLVVAAGINFNLRNANEYRWVWVNQQRFYWQLAWRAPGLQPGTALVADGELMSRSSIYSTSFALNLLYAAEEPRLDYQPDLWFFSLGRTFGNSMPLYLAGTDLSAKIRDVEFSVSSANSLVLDYRPGEANCLHILRPEDSADALLPPYARQAAAVSNLERILPQGSPVPRRTNIFGPEPGQSWCYYYEKAELARQMEDWEGLVTLADEAAAQGYTPLRSESSTAMEWRAFIEGYARAGSWEQAVLLTRQAFERQPDYQPMLCALWDQPALRSAEGAALREELACHLLPQN
jgi:hypothetical protein